MSETSTTGAYVYQQICKSTADWAADSSVIPENVWLFERRTDGKIITKLSDGLHIYSQLDEYGLSAWDAAQLGGYKGTKAEFCAALGLTDEKIKTVTDLIVSLDGKFTETPTLVAKPTEITLTYKSGEVTRSFAIGQQCRVYDTKDKKYVFYQLYDITADNKADWQITGSDGSDGSSAIEMVKITLFSNQGIADTSLYGSVVSIVYAEQQIDRTWNGVELSITVPMQAKYQVIFPDVEGYLSPDIQEYTAVAGEKRAIVVTYSTEKLTVNVSATDSVSTAGRTTTLTNIATSQVIASKKGASVVFKIPFGVNYKVSIDDFSGYISPAVQSFTANSVACIVFFEYEKMVDSSIVFDKSISDPQNITGDINAGVIATILSKFRRCLCKKTAEGEVSIIYLGNNDSRFYEDGSVAMLDGTEGDVMVDFPEFYYKRETVDVNKFRYRFAEHNVDGEFKYIGRSLVGVYKGCTINYKMYSRRGITPYVNHSANSIDAAATSRGSGYQYIDYQQHCVIAFMLYAKYGNRNLRAVLGDGRVESNPYPKTGSTSADGNRDSIKEKYGYVNGLGLEGVLGYPGEWVKGVMVDSAVWRITEPDGTTRAVRSIQYGGWISAMAAESSDFFDMVPTAINGSETTHYSDQYAPVSGDPKALIRSYGGVSGVRAANIASKPDEHATSRLAFRGIIHEAPSVEVFKSLPIL